MADEAPFLRVAARTRVLAELPHGRAVIARANFQDPTHAEHLSWRLSRAVGFFEGKPQRACLWLGFVQGVLATRHISLAELDLVNKELGLGSYEEDR